MFALKACFKCITYVMLNLRDVSPFQNISEAHSHRGQMLFIPGWPRSLFLNILARWPEPGKQELPGESRDTRYELCLVLSTNNREGQHGGTDGEPG